jgi:hypothetical protein
MGMFDSVWFLGKAAERVTCAAGHPLVGELQTKDLDGGMDRYFVHATDAGLQLFTGKAHRKTIERVIERGAFLRETVVSDYLPSLLSVTIDAYGSCGECDPVVYEREVGSVYGDAVGEARARCEYELTFVKGLLTAVEPVRVESRDQVRERLQKTQVVTVLPDDDRIAKRHLELLRKENKATEAEE